MAELLDPYATDRTAQVSVVIAGQEYGNVAQYSYDTDVLQLGDPCSVLMPNPRGVLNGKIALGDSLQFYIADPDVNGGARVQKLKGIVTSRQCSSSDGGGTVVTVGGADLGWHLANNVAPLWFRLRGIMFSALLRKVLDSSWGIIGVRAENDTNRALKLGRAGVVQAISGSIDSIIPPIQIEPGEMIADVLILYAKRERKLVNVSSDGYLQFWAPKKTGQPLYRFDLHSTGDARHASNNIERVTLSEAIDGLFTEVICVGTVVRPPEVLDPRNPNEGHFRGTHRAPATLPFVRRFTFADGDQLTKEMADDRARWKAERGLFDSWQYVIQVRGHSQNGAFFEPDTFADVDDTVNGVQGVLYVSAVRYARDLRSGQTTTLTLRKPGLLGA